MNRASLLALSAAAILTAACSTEPQGTQLSLTMASTMAVNGGGTPGTETYTDGQNSLTLTMVEVVLREVELKPVEIADCDAIPEPTECRDFEVGPTLVSVPLGAVTPAQNVNMFGIGTAFQPFVENTARSDIVFIEQMR